DERPSGHLVSRRPERRGLLHSLVARRTVLCAHRFAENSFLSKAREPFRQVLERLEIVDDVRHGGPYALTAADGRQVREFFAPADGKRQRAVTYPGLLDLQIMRHVLDKLVDRVLVLLVGCQLGLVQKILDWSLLQERWM